LRNSYLFLKNLNIVLFRFGHKFSIFLELFSFFFTKIRHHQFVFGQILGTGSFSCARYAKLIQQDAPPSSWPAYCIKIINKQLV
jgi:hypothetical protein